MGAYLSAPISEKVSTDGSSKHIDYGASSMQGWRVSQEDAHNAVLDFDVNTHLFAVYDGHGGHEVAIYTSLKLPEFIKKTDAYKNGDFKLALKQAFLDFDATLVTPEVIGHLKQIVGTNGEEEEEESESEEEEVDNLFKEANMPITEVIAKYGENPHLARLKKDKDKKGVSPFLRAKGAPVSSDPPIKFDVEDCGPSSSSSSSSSLATSKEELKGEPDSSVKKEVNGDMTHINGDVTKNEELDNEVKNESEEKVKVEDKKELENGEVTVNGEEQKVTVGKGKSSGKGVKGKGKAIVKKTKEEVDLENKEKKRIAALKAEQIYKKIQECGSEDELSDTDEDDDSFEEIPVEDGEGEDGVDGSSDSDIDEEESPEEDEDDDEDEEEEEEEEEDDDDDEDEGGVAGEDPCTEFAMSMKEEPGFDSGCTACLALIRGSELYVANVGDSRIVVCRDGEAVDMSIDHKPEDDPESARIIRAGGRVTEDGRVNGGLNLSRALGDHGYKQNKSLGPEDQMISPLPDIQSMTLGEKDKFIIVACDGIWNSMTSQEACDFVSDKLNEKVKLTKICEDMFDYCLAPDTLGDGTGCDNMTCIILTLKDFNLVSSGSIKRTADEAENENVRQEKKQKCDSDNK